MCLSVSEYSTVATFSFSTMDRVLLCMYTEQQSAIGTFVLVCGKSEATRWDLYRNTKVSPTDVVGFS